MNSPPLVSSAQAILAILLANAMAATLAGLRANNAVSQGQVQTLAAQSRTANHRGGL